MTLEEIDQKCDYWWKVVCRKGRYNQGSAPSARLLYAKEQHQRYSRLALAMKYANPTKQLCELAKFLNDENEL